MKTLFSNIVLIFLTLSLFSQNNYTTGNQAYWTERGLGFHHVTIGGGNIVYAYDTTNHIYRNGNKILIPNLSSSQNGDYIIDSTFFGFGIGGNPDNNNYQWDKQKVIIPQCDFDKDNLFVSPVSSFHMTYGQAIQHNSTYCTWASCEAIVDGPAETLSYRAYSPLNDTFQLWTGEELIDAGDIKGTGTIAKISQQQLDTTPNMSYCVSTYGQGWRLPTDIEAGHYNDLEGPGNGFHNGYKGNSSDYIWTSSLFKTYTVKRWPLGLSDGYWENCGGFIYVANLVRCVFHSEEDTTAAPKGAVSGYVMYGNDTTAKMDGVCLILKDINDNFIDSITSDTSGHYSFRNLLSGFYQIEAVCNKVPGGFNSVDALMMMRHFVMFDTIAGLPFMAADVDTNGYINSNDALATALRFVGLISTFPSGDWVFDNDTIVVGNSPVYKDIHGLSYGDVNASYQLRKKKVKLLPE